MQRNIFVLSCAVVIGLTAYSLVSLLPVGAPGEIQSYTRTDIGLNEYTSSTQSNVSVDVDASGRIGAVWDSRRQEAGTYGVRARALTREGRALADEAGVNLTTASMQESPSVIWLEDGPVVAWVSFGQDGSGRGVYARGPHSSESLLAEMVDRDQVEVVLAALDGQTAVAAWATDTEVGREVRARLLDATGAPVGEEFLVSQITGVIDRIPSVAASADGFVVAWDRTQQDGEISGIRARCFDSGGNATTDEFAVGAGDVDEIEPSVAMDAAGNFAVAWMRLDPATDYDPMFLRYDAEGQPLSGPERLCSDPAGWQSGIALSMNESGELAAAWNRYDNEGGSDIWTRFFDSNGVPRGVEMIATAHVDGPQMLASHSGAQRLVLNEDGSLVLAWSGDAGGADPTAANVTLLRSVVKGSETGSEDDLFAVSASPDSPHSTESPESPALPALPAWFSEGPSADETALSEAVPGYDPSHIAYLPHHVEQRAGGDIGFTGVNDTGWFPPDCEMAVGPEHILLTTNGAIAARLKDGTQLWQQPIEGGGGFWGVVGASGLIFDPEVHYDNHEDRFLAMANERNGSQSYMLLGVSSTADPEDAWHKYRFNVTALAREDIDSPNMSFDENGIYIGADFFQPNDYLVYIIEKSSVLNGGAASVSSFYNNGSHSFGMPEHMTDEAERTYMIEHFDGNQTSVRFWAIDDPFGTPTTETVEIPVDNYLVPGIARSRGTSTVVTLFEARFWSCMYINGSLWACHHIRIPDAVTPKARWYEFDMKGWPTSGMTPEVKQSGTIDAGDEVYLFFNSIAADPSGNAYMVFARSGTNEYFSIARTYRLGSDAPGVMHGPDFIRESTTSYNVNRWGDYSDVQADPASPGKFWSHHEYAVSPSTWRTWVQCETIQDPTSTPDELAGQLTADGNLRTTPNPFTGRATLSFTLDVESDVRAELFDAAGRRIRTLEMSGLSAGDASISWDGRTTDGGAAPSGTYFARVFAGGEFVASGRMVKLD